MTPWSASPKLAAAADGRTWAGWYRGDLHAHTIHSDGSWDIPDLLAFWQEQGVDFMTLSDHNTISGLPQACSLSTPELLVMGGIELSTYFGHAVAGARRRGSTGGGWMEACCRSLNWRRA